MKKNITLYTTLFVLGSASFSLCSFAADPYEAKNKEEVLAGPVPVDTRKFVKLGGLKPIEVVEILWGESYTAQRKMVGFLNAKPDYGLFPREEAQVSLVKNKGVDYLSDLPLKLYFFDDGTVRVDLFERDNPGIDVSHVIKPQ